MRSVVSILAFVFVATSRVLAQDVVVTYPDNVGSIVRYSMADGSKLSTVKQVYLVGTNVYLPTRVAVSPDVKFLYVVFGSRYVAQLRASDGTVVWVVDGGFKSGPVTYPVADIAATGDSVFASNEDPTGRIVRYRASDGVLLWSFPRAVQVGYLIHSPWRLAATGTVSFYALLGATFLSRINQPDAGIAWRIDVALKSGPTTWGAYDLAQSGGFAYIASQDPSATLRKYNTSTTALIWSVSRPCQIGGVGYAATKLTASGSDTLMTLCGDRYLARIRTSDGRMLWSKDIGLMANGFLYLPADIATIGSP